MAVSKTVSLVQFFNYCVQNGLPCAFYRLPEAAYIKVTAQKNNKAHKVKNAASEKGFLFAPFKQDKDFKTVFIRPDVFTTADKLPALNFAQKKDKNIATGIQKLKIKEATRKQFVEYVKSIQQDIKQGNFKKVVAARVVKKKKPADFDPVTFFEQLCKKYSSAFTSLVYTPQYGIWIGASPEILLQVNEGRFKTYSLAGTKVNHTEKAASAWGAKEQEEQKIVSRYITSAFKKVSKEKPQITGPETVAAGNLFHLRTTFIYSHIATDKWPEVVKQLHPTPAVAGLPKDTSIAFIKQQEIAPRGFYSGYLGPVNLDNEIALFVNLRCMRVLKKKLAVFVGCGVTSSSVPRDEWNETKMKSQTLLSVLKPAKK